MRITVPPAGAGAPPLVDGVCCVLELEQAAEIVGDLGIVAGWTRRQLPADRR